MAYYNVNFVSNVLKRTVEVGVVLPNDLREEERKVNVHYNRQIKTLVFLHGHSGHMKSLLFGSSIEELALKYNIAVILPNGENSFYVDSGADRCFGKYVGIEVIEYFRKTFHLSDKREDTYIAGISMGGFGATRLGLKYPEYYSKIAAMSPAYIIHNIENQGEEYADEIAGYNYYHSIFGDLSNLEESDKNPEWLVEKLVETGEEIPKLYITCGTEDFLLEENRMFKDFLKENRIPVIYKESPGTHDWLFWNKELEPIIRWMLEIK